MMPYDTYRLYQTERTKTTAEIRRADQQAGQLAAAASSLFRALTRPVRAVRTLYPPQHAACRARQEPLAARQAERGNIPAYHRRAREIAGTNDGHRFMERILAFVRSAAR